MWTDSDNDNDELFLTHRGEVLVMFLERGFSAEEAEELTQRALGEAQNDR